jgi:TonB family protein
MPRELILLLSTFLFFACLSQAQPKDFEDKNAKTNNEIENLRKQEIKLTLLSTLKSAPKDSIDPYTKGGFFQLVFTLQIGKNQLSSKNLMLLESGSAYICNTFKRRFLSKEHNDLFMTKKSEKKILGPYIFTLFIEKNGSIYETTEEQLKYVPGLISIAKITEAPVFPGCKDLQAKELKSCFQKQMQAHIASNFRYPKEALSNGHEGDATVFFNVTQEGTLNDIRTQAKNPQFAREAERIISLLPKMKPGTYKGLKIDTPFAIPIQFRLQ